MPAHEALWFDGRMLTHASCEWAMAAYLAPPFPVAGRHDERLVAGEVPAWYAKPALDPDGPRPGRAPAPALRHASLLPADFFRRTFRS